MSECKTKATQAFEAGRQLAQTGKRTVPAAHSQFFRDPGLRKAYKRGHRAWFQEQAQARQRTAPADMAHPRDMTMDTAGCCGVVSVAILAGVTLREARAAIRKGVAKYRGRNSARSWRGGGTHHPERMTGLAHLGCTVETMDFEADGLTLQAFLRGVEGSALKGKRLLIQTNRHVQIVKDGRVTDQAHVNEPVATYDHRRRKVKKVTVIAED